MVQPRVKFYVPVQSPAQSPVILSSWPASYARSFCLNKADVVLLFRNVLFINNKLEHFADNVFYGASRVTVAYLILVHWKMYYIRLGAR